MLVTADSRNPLETRTDLLVVPVPAVDGPRRRLPGRLAGIDRALDGRIQNIVESGDFRGKKQQRALLYPDGALPAKRVLLVGLGPESAVDAEVLRAVAGDVVKEAAQRHAAKVTVAMPGLRRVKPPLAGQALAEGALLGGYRFDEYKTPGEDPPGEVAAFQICFERAPDARAARAGARRGTILAESQNVARDLSNQPGNALPPAALAREAQKVAREVGLRSKVLGPAELKKQKMGAILAVGGGSHNSPRMIALEHKPKRTVKKGEAICFVGKGVTFDSGGISIKPAAAMDEMKHDMSGAATVVGALRACALLGVPHHVVGIIGAAENLPSATAYRPGDVVTAASGQTIEVLNTDAEGRVVLADALHFARTQYSPRAIIDLATLTGACVVALGRWASGLFGNNDKLVEAVRQAGDDSAEIAWPLPLFDGHRKAVRSEIADIKNTGAGREAGSSTAAAFLAAFAGDVPWVHLDIAGTAWTSRPGSYQPRGATGVGVRLLLQLLDSWKSVRL
ncbi:MAG: leucyl aminopeptidase [Myxococcota bacterium]|nr:leucyl aminopeptidase [Myxococcota bacterium]